MAAKKTLVFFISLFLFTSLQANEYSPPVGKNYPDKLLWGDTHLHSNQSADAWSIGNSNLTPSDAFRFARGEEVTSESGVKAKLRVPLDFFMVSDHATYLGIFKRIENSDPDVISTPLGKRWRGYMDDNDPRLFTEFVEGLNGNQEQTFEKEIYSPIWKEITDNVDSFNQPGIFTAFIGYEWTPAPTGDNLHRVVIFKDDAEKAQKIIPFSALDSNNPEDLWSFLKNYNETTGGEAISISHNSNISGGRMFPLKNSYGEPIDRAYADMRNRWEPLVEATQVKGDSETHPAVSPNDPFADYETWEGNIGRNETHRLERISTTGDCANSENYKCYRYKKSETDRYKGSYVRPALRRGLEIQKKIGVNPFKFGVIGSTDNHTALTASAEDNFFGKFVDSEPGPGRMSNCMAGCDRPDGEDNGDLWRNWLITASGYAAVWARENTREEIFDAMKRRETYATTGPRMAVRFFGGWNFSKEDSYSPNFVDIGYTKGVPMGSDLGVREKRKSPGFLVMVSKDPNGANIERVQIIKGWVDSYGRSQEKIYDVAVADDAGESTVNIEKATYDNSIGEAYFSTHWKDPDFNPNLSAFYYVRVLEIPTPRWTTYDSVAFGIDIPSYVPKTHQERAYTSSIWYNP
ncbi:MAG: DUF3604 domain-containing protein [Pseudomonadota bacterium]|nr:DUF3604 domain-containing protein [Pseudomonadota bacterium]